MLKRSLVFLLLIMSCSVQCFIGTALVVFSYAAVGILAVGVATETTSSVMSAPSETEQAAIQKIVQTQRMYESQLQRLHGRKERNEQRLNSILDDLKNEKLTKDEKDALLQEKATITHNNGDLQAKIEDTKKRFDAYREEIEPFVEHLNDTHKKREMEKGMLRESLAKLIAMGYETITRSKQGPF